MRASPDSDRTFEKQMILGGLRKVERLLALPGGWRQAKDDPAGGRTLGQAFDEALEVFDPASAIRKKATADALRAATGDPSISLDDWNDAPGRTVQDVEELFARAGQIAHRWRLGQSHRLWREDPPDDSSGPSRP